MTSFAGDYVEKLFLHEDSQNDVIKTLKAFQLVATNEPYLNIEKVPCNKFVGVCKKKGMTLLNSEISSLSMNLRTSHIKKI